LCAKSGCGDGKDEDLDPVAMMVRLLQRERDGTRPATAGDEDDDETAATEDEGAGGEEEEKEGDGEAVPPKPRMVNVTVDGRDVPVSEADLVAAWQQQNAQGNRRGPQADPEAMADERYKGFLAAFANGIPQIMGPEPDWAREFAADPQGTAGRFKSRNQIKDLMAMAVGEHQRMERATSERQRHAHREKSQAEATRLVEIVPEWKDKAVARRELAAIRDHSVKHGFHHGAVDDIGDARVMALARKAMLYDQMMAKKPEIDKRLAEAPRVLKPGAKSTAGSLADRRKAAMDKLTRTGSVEDAATLLLLG
jgi:hypothetical protein